MTILIPENDKKPGVCYAVTDDGIEVPVIDVTHPAFRVQLTEQEIAAEVARAIAEVESWARIPREEQEKRFMVQMRGSFLAPRLGAARGTILGGMSTYFVKLGPENLGKGYAKDIDRVIAGSLPCLSTRLRLQNMARLMADSLVPPLEEQPGAPLHLLNIAGGPGMDSLNAILLLQKEHPGLLRARGITIHLLDPDTAGPAFGARAARALQADGGPLGGLQVAVGRVPYDWSSPGALAEMTRSLESQGAVIAGSSEGGLFEYGSDEQIAANLRAFHVGTGKAAVMVGTVTRADGAARALNKAGGAALVLRGLEAFAALAREAGWRVARAADSPLSHDVVLEKA
jgi:hypothetical protein